MRFSLLAIQGRLRKKTRSTVALKFLLNTQPEYQGQWKMMWEGNCHSGVVWEKRIKDYSGEEACCVSCKLFFFAEDGVAYLMLAMCSSSYELELILKATGEPVVLSKLSKSK